MNRVSADLGMRRTRLAMRHDLPTVIDIENASFSNPWPRELLRRQLGLPGFFVYEEDGHVCGYIIIQLHRPSLLSWLEQRLSRWLGQSREPALPSGHVINLAIAPAHRRRGLARLLLEVGFDYLQRQDARYVDLEVRVTNQAAIKLYEGLGFQVIALLPHYYQTDEDAYLMRKWFQPTADLDRVGTPR
jgi:ribosomal-protein-alanine N-acetyltransferase